MERKGKVVDAHSDNFIASAETSLRNTQVVQQAMQEKMIEIQAMQRGMSHKEQMEGKQYR